MFTVLEKKCPKTCMCKLRGATFKNYGGEELDANNYCNHFCSSPDYYEVGTDQIQYGSFCGSNLKYMVGDYINCTQCAETQSKPHWKSKDLTFNITY